MSGSIDDVTRQLTPAQRARLKELRRQQRKARQQRSYLEQMAKGDATLHLKVLREKKRRFDRAERVEQRRKSGEGSDDAEVDQ